MEMYMIYTLAYDDVIFENIYGSIEEAIVERYVNDLGFSIMKLRVGERPEKVKVTLEMLKEVQRKMCNDGLGRKIKHIEEDHKNGEVECFLSVCAKLQRELERKIKQSRPYKRSSWDMEGVELTKMNWEEAPQDLVSREKMKRGGKR
jgi:hypothetical protein